MVKINVCMGYLIGGAYIGMLRIAKALPQYEWCFSTTIDKDAGIVIYMNEHRFYQDAKRLKIPHIIQRKTGIRSLKVKEPADLDAVVCGSAVSYKNSSHKKRVLIYNGIDLEHLKTIKLKPNVEWLIAESRIGIGQQVEKSIKHAIKHSKHLTILGSGKGVAENTYDNLRKKYPMCSWVGRVSPDEALSYIKGCNAIIVSNPSHGVANQILEATMFDKKIINFGNCEIPNKADIDINVTARKYKELINSCF